jgi:hypothetical protein
MDMTAKTARIAALDRRAVIVGPETVSSHDEIENDCEIRCDVDVLTARCSDPPTYALSSTPVVAISAAPDASIAPLWRTQAWRSGRR